MLRSMYELISLIYGHSCILFAYVSSGNKGI